jgi:hypothetical protein
MQICAEWQKHKLEINKINNINIGIIQKTGIVSLLIIIIVIANLLIDILFKTKTPDNYISRDFVSNFVIFVLGQAAIISRNSRMKKTTQQLICSAVYFFIFINKKIIVK